MNFHGIARNLPAGSSGAAVPFRRLHPEGWRHTLQAQRRIGEFEPTGVSSWAASSPGDSLPQPEIRQLDRVEANKKSLAEEILAKCPVVLMCVSSHRYENYMDSY